MMVSAPDILNASILIVDDQESNVSLLEQMLHEAGYLCITSTTDPYTVCALHRANHYDLILLDLQMPGMDGFQVMEGLKEIEHDGYVPILVITTQPGHKLRALASGAKDFVAKPFDLVEVKMRIHNMLEVRLLYTQLEHNRCALESLALHDPLTGLPNRRLLMDRLSLAIAHALRNKCTMAVMFLDLDEFKQINDTLGHDAGDTMLRMVADRLVTTVRQADTAARLGDDVAKLASKVVKVVSQPYSIQGSGVHMTASVGVSIYPTHGEEVETLMKSADLVLYEAKRIGKSKYRIAARTDVLAMVHS